MVAGAFEAEALVILTDTPGLLRAFPGRVDADHARSRRAKADQFMSFAEGRMKKKVMGAVEAIGEGVGQGDLRGRPRRREPISRALCRRRERTSPSDCHGTIRRAADRRTDPRRDDGAPRRRGVRARRRLLARRQPPGAATSISRRHRASRCSATAIRASATPSRGRPRTLMLCPNYLYNDVRARVRRGARRRAAAAPPARLSRQQRRRSRRWRAQVRASRDRAIGVRLDHERVPRPHLRARSRSRGSRSTARASCRCSTTTHVPFNDVGALDAGGRRLDGGGDPRSRAGRERRQRRHAGFPARRRSDCAASAARC